MKKQIKKRLTDLNLKEEQIIDSKKLKSIKGGEEIVIMEEIVN